MKLFKMTMSALFCVLVLTVACSASASKTPQIKVDTSGARQYRICSNRFSVLIPITNSGDSDIQIKSVRSACSSCTKIVAQKEIISPGETINIQVLGRQSTQGFLDLSFYIISNDPVQPEMKVSLKVNCKSVYWLDVYWKGSSEKQSRQRNPYRPESMSVRKTPNLVLEIVSIAEDIDIDEVEIESALFQETSTTFNHNRATVEMASQIEIPGMYNECLDLIINNSDRMLVPLQLLMTENCRVVNENVSFSYLKEGETAKCQVQLVFDDPENIWKEFKIVSTREMERAILFTKATDEGAGKVTIDFEVDARFLGGAGRKTIPLGIAGDQEGEMAHFVLFGQVY